MGVLRLARNEDIAYTYSNMKIYLGSDHRGFQLKEKVFAYLAKQSYDVEDVGGKEMNPDDDFPQFAQAAALRVIGDDSEDPRAILICGADRVCVWQRIVSKVSARALFGMRPKRD